MPSNDLQALGEYRLALRCKVPHGLLCLVYLRWTKASRVRSLIVLYLDQAHVRQATQSSALAFHSRSLMPFCICALALLLSSAAIARDPRYLNQVQVLVVGERVFKSTGLPACTTHRIITSLPAGELGGHTALQALPIMPALLPQQGRLCSSGAPRFRRALATPALHSDGRSAAEQPTTSGYSSEELAGRLARGLVATAAICSIIGAAAPSAHAHEIVWRPRRHHRRLDERFYSNWADEVVEVGQGVQGELHPWYETHRAECSNVGLPLLHHRPSC